MIDIVLVIVFSIVMLFFMLFPAMKITEWIDGRFSVPQRYHTAVTLGIDIFLSLGIGLFLKF